MAYSEEPANRVRALLSDRDDIDERRMFGGLTTVAPDGLKGQALRHWVARALARADTQPPKHPKRRAVTG
jgi:hypothetical protein